MATYKHGTMTFMEQMDDEELEFGEEITLEGKKRVKRVVLIGSDFERILPNKRDRAYQALRMSDRTEIIDDYSAAEKKRLAERAGKHVTLIHQVINPDKPNEATRPMILCAVLLRDEVPCAEEVDHILMTMQRETLYIHCNSRDHNCRNLLIRLCLDYANAGHKCPTLDWLIFTNSVVLWFSKKLGMVMPRLDAWDPDFDFVEKEPYKQLLAKWEQLLRQVGFCNRQEYRNALVKAFLKRSSAVKSRADVQEHISEKTSYHESYARAVFGGTGGRVGSREMLVLSAIELGCSLKETNLLLREANQAPLYPCWQEDIEAIQKLRRNKGLLSLEELEYFLSRGVITYEE